MVLITCIVVIELVLLGKLISTFHRARQRSAKMLSGDPEATRASAVVVVACKGEEPDLAEALERFAAQRRPNYQLVLVTATEDDDAVPTIQGVVRRHAHARHLVAGVDERYAQKNFNLIRGLEAAPGAELYAFGDSDISPDPDWLSRLLLPLSDPRIGATTGYRWYVSERPTLWDLLTTLWSGSVLTFMAIPSLRFVWGGSYALRREVIEKLELRTLWRDVLSDDLTVTAALRKHRYKLEFVPSCVSLTRAAFTFSEMIDFTTRQMVMLRLYGGQVFAGLAFLLLASNSAALFAPWAFLAGSALVGIALVAIARAVLPKGGPRQPRWAVGLVFPLVVPLLSSAVLIAMLKRKLNWRGVVYRIHSGGRMTMEPGPRAGAPAPSSDGLQADSAPIAASRLGGRITEEPFAR